MIWTNAFQILTSLGKLSALAGFILMAATIILAARLRFLEKRLHGLNRVYLYHHQLGAIAFILLLLHPLFLTVRYLPISVQSAALFLVPSLTLWPQTLGTISLAIMTLLLIITFYFAWRYQVWKFSHRFLLLAFFLGFLHVAFITSDVSQNLALRACLLTLGGLALIAYAYRLMVEFGDIGKHEYVVSQTRQIGPAVWEIKLVPSGQPFTYLPGQFAFLEEHPFSFISTPAEKDLGFAIKALGDYTKTVPQIKLGTKIKIEGPYGAFGQGEKSSAREIWIAGGIGITPFISLAKNLKKSGRWADLYISFSNRQETIYQQELEMLASENSSLKVILHYSDEMGHLSAKKIAKLSGNLIGREIYICGPAGMMKSLKKQFIMLGVKAKNIHTEEFALL